MTEEKDFENNPSEINETAAEETAEVITEAAEAEGTAFDEERPTVEEVAENKTASEQTSYAALGGHVSSAKVPRINKNRLKFGSLSTLFTILFIAIVIAENVVVTLAAQRF